MISKFVIFCFILMNLNLNLVGSLNEKRALIFPRGNPTRHQFIAGFGIPLQKLAEALVIGYVFKAQYFLPYNVSQLRPNFTRDRRSLDDFEVYNVEPIVLSENDLNDEPDSSESQDDVRWSIYESIEIILNSKGMHGKQCLLRAICEINQIPFHLEQSGLVGELLHVFFRWFSHFPEIFPNFSGDFSPFSFDFTQIFLYFPSSPSTTTQHLNDYQMAEISGKSNAPCSQIFSKCRTSLLDIFSEIYL